MITESRFWRESLLDWAGHIERRQDAHRWSDRSIALVEKAAMLGFFTVRRLIEAKASLTQAMLRVRTPVTSYKPIGGRFTFFDRFVARNHFDLDSPRERQFVLTELANQFIHSYVFNLVYDDRGHLHSFLFVSDWHRRKALYQVSAAAVARVFRRVAHDEPRQLDLRYDEKQDDWRVLVSR